VKKSWDVSHSVDPTDPKKPLRKRYAKKQTKVIDLPVHAPIRKKKEKKEIDWKWAAENMTDEELENFIHENA